MANFNNNSPKLYFNAIKVVLDLHGYEAEKWLDKNSKHLSGTATVKEQAEEEINNLVKK